MLRSYRLFARALRAPLLATAAVGGLLLQAAGPLSAQVLFDEVATVGDTAAVGVVERDLTITTAGEHDISARDLATPAALTSLQVAITRGTTVVSSFQISNAAPSPQTRRVDLAAGTYRVRLVGTPSAAERAGSVSLEVVRVAGGVQVLQFNDALSLAPPPIPANTRLFEASFTVTEATTHTLSLADLAFPAPAQQLQLILTRGATVVGTPLASAGSISFTGQPQATGDPPYTVRLIVTATGAAAGALATVRVRSAAGAILFDQAIAAGQVRAAGSRALSAGAHTLRLTDLAFPSALASSQVIGVFDGAAAARATAPGDAAFVAASGEHQFFVIARPGTEPGTGSYAVQVLQATTPVFSAAQAVTVGTPTTQAFSYAADLPVAGGYQARLADFQFPNTFSSLRLLATQGGTAVGTLSAVGNAEFANLRAGPLFLLVLAQPGGVSGGGVFGVEVAPGAGGAVLFDVNQGAGALFTARRVTVSTAGRYDVAVRDLGFPANFIELFALVTRGATRVGSVFGGGNFSFDATAGTYFINFVARPDVTQRAGTYSINVSPAPPPPNLTLTAAAASVTSGSSTTLSWSAQNATSCTASGGWTGNRPTSGNEASPAVTASTTFTLTCNGAGGTTAQSVTVAIATPPPPAGGGGGRFELSWLLLLAGLLATSRWMAGRVHPESAVAAS